MGLSAHDAFLLPGCARLNVIDVGERRSVRLSGSAVQSVRALTTTKEIGDLEFTIGAGTLGLSKMAGSGLDALDFTGTQYLNSLIASRQRYNAARSTPSRWVMAVVYSTTFNSAGFPALASRWTGVAAQQQYILLHRHTVHARPACSIIEASTLTERASPTAVGATGNDGNPHVLFLYMDGTVGSMNVYVQLDGTARQSVAIAGTNDPGATSVLQIGGASAVSLFAQAKIGAVVWGESGNPTQTVASLLRWARSRWRVA